MTGFQPRRPWHCAPIVVLLGTLATSPLVATADQPAGRNSAAQVILDRSTGTTLQVTTSPWVLAFDQPLLAANTRDYVALYAVVTSNGGQRRHYIAAFYTTAMPA